MAHHYDDGPDIVATNKKIKKKEEEIKNLESEKETLIKKKAAQNARAIKLSEQLQELKEVRDTAEKSIIEVKLELDKHCIHDKVRTETRNVPGGYLDRAEYWTYYYCEVCGKKIDEKVKYGGFA